MLADWSPGRGYDRDGLLVYEVPYNTTDAQDLSTLNAFINGVVNGLAHLRTEKQRQHPCTVCEKT